MFPSPCKSPLSGVTRTSRSVQLAPLPVFSPLGPSFPFLPLSIVCFCLSPRFFHPFSLWVSQCLTLHLYFSACLGPSVYALVSPRLSHIFAFFVWLPLSPSFQPPSAHTPHSPVYDIPRAGRWAGLQQRGGERGRRSLPPAVNLHASGLCGWQRRGKAQLPAWRR